jgi:hypothetical protein
VLDRLYQYYDTFRFLRNIEKVIKAVSAVDSASIFHVSVYHNIDINF